MSKSDSRYTAHSATAEEMGPGRADATTEAKAADLVQDLTSYLSKLGLGDADLAVVMSLIQGKETKALIQGTNYRETAIEAGHPTGVAAEHIIKLYLAEEQSILREIYQSALKGQPTIRLLGSSGDTSSESLVAVAKALSPDVMCLGVKVVQPATVETLELVREAHPQIASVLLFGFYDFQGIKALRQFSAGASTGFAYLLKHTIDTVEQLTQVVHSVAEGRIIVDPTVLGGMIHTGDMRNSLIRELSPKEFEVLSWMAKGYRNETIAGVLSRDVKTVERHINNIYSKLQGDEPSMDPRVNAALIYLKATGLLPTEQLTQE